MVIAKITMSQQKSEYAMILLFCSGIRSFAVCHWKPYYKNLPSMTIIILEINNYIVLNAINELSTEGRKLKKEEHFEYKSKAGNAKIGNGSTVNMAKLLYELGGQTLEQQRIETLKVKTLDLLSDKASWKLIRQGKQIEVKILHREWLFPITYSVSS